MHNDGKVVPINRAHATPSPLARLPVVLLQVRDRAAQQLQQGLQELFDNADDTLFEMADKARSTVDHHIFFKDVCDLRHSARTSSACSWSGYSKPLAAWVRRGGASFRWCR